MKKQLISETFKNRLQELAGIVQENAYKIAQLGFAEPIAQYLGNLDKKRGLFFADSLTREFLNEKGMGDLGKENIKKILESINQEELFNYIKSRENDIITIIDWIKLSQSQVDMKSIGGFNDILSVASNSPAKAGAVENKVNFSEEVERYLRKVEYDTGIELGILALRSFAKHDLKGKGINVEKEDVNKILELIDQKQFLHFLKMNENELIIIAEWINSPLRQETEGVISGAEKTNFIKEKGFIDFNDVLGYANTWHTNLTASGVVRDHSIGRIIERYPSGYYWIDLDTNASPDEGQAMGHCGTDMQATTLLSLRDEKGEPHVTVAYNKDNKSVTQVKGRGNKKPVEKYMTYVQDFLKKLSKSGDLTEFKWSYPAFGSDLSDEEVKDILKSNPKQYFNYLKQGIKQSASNIGIRY